MNKRGVSGGLIFLILIIIVAIIFFLNMNGESKGKVCGTHTEYYQSSAKSCDKIQNCECLHESWGGLGACDSCNCAKEVSNC